MKIDFIEKFNELKSYNDILKKIEVKSNIKIFYGVSKEGKKRLVFLSSIIPNQIESTKVISVNLYKDNDQMYWISFDLENSKFDNLFFTFCSDMVNLIINLSSEEEELSTISRRFYSWKKMFQNIVVKELSEEKEQGLFGELYYLYKFMIPKYGIDNAINSWAGPLKYNKDFSIDNDWYEVKTSSISSNSIKITSLNQLESDIIGRLIVVRVEKMSSEFNKNLSCILDLIKNIMEEITNISTQDSFINKIVEYGIGPENDFGTRKFDVKEVDSYIVDEKFPKLTSDNIKYSEIINASYVLDLKGIEKYKENA